MILMVVLLLLLILFPDGFLRCDHGLDFLGQIYFSKKIGIMSILYIYLPSDMI